MKMRTRMMIGAAVSALLGSFAGPAQAAMDMFLTVRDENDQQILGGSQDFEFQGAIDAHSFSLGYSVSVVTDPRTGTPIASETVFSPLAVVASTDSATVDLWRAGLTNELLRSVRLDLRVSGEVPQPFAAWELTDVMLTGLSTSGSTGTDDSTVTYLFGGFRTITYTFFEQGKNGDITNESFTYDLARGTFATSGNVESFQIVTGGGAPIPVPDGVAVATPEPAAMSLLALAGMVALRRQRR